MRSLLRCALFAVVILSSFFSFSQVFSLDQHAGGYVPGEVLVRFRETSTASARISAHARSQAVVRRQYKIVPNLQLVRVPATVSVEAAIAAYRSDPNVLYAQPNYVRRATQSPATPNDPRFANLWGLHNTGANGGGARADIMAPEAWGISKGDRNIVVAVIDSGIDYTHPDLAPNIWNNSGDCNNNAVDDDGDGYIDDCHGIDTVNGDGDPMDDAGHGTHVAGTIGAVGNNSVGVVGVNWTTTIIGCKFLSAFGSGSDEGAIQCLDWLAGLKQRGVNLVATSNSWGGTGYSQALHDAIQAHRDLGILFIAAAGNASADNDNSEFYPANFAVSNVISVAATTRMDVLAGFSSYGRHTVHIGAPGDQVESTYPGQAYATMSGTSMATPHVTGTVALLAAAHPELDWKALKNRVISSGDVLAALQSSITGRRLNAYAALTCSDSEALSLISPYQQVLGSVGQPANFSALHINCGSPAGAVAATFEPGGATATLADDGQGADEVAGDGIYSGAWTPPTRGIYTFNLGAESDKLIVDPYVATAAPLQWRDTSTIGAGFSLGSPFTTNDVVFLSSPFPVSIAGRALSQLVIARNGIIMAPIAGDAAISTRLPIPAADVVLAPFGELLYADGPVNTRNVFSAVLGQAPNRELVIEWRDMPQSECQSPSDGGVTFQVVFFESKTDILYNYKDVVFGGSCAAHDNGASANVGLQPGSGSAVQYSFQHPDLADNTSIVWKLDPDFPANPVPTLASIAPDYFVTSSYYGRAWLTARGSNLLPSSLFLVDGSPRDSYSQGSTVSHFALLRTDFAHPHTIKAAMFNALPGGGASQTIDYEIKQQDFTIQLSSATLDMSVDTMGTTTVTMLPAPAVIDPVDFTCTTSDPRLTCLFSRPAAIGSFEAPIPSVLYIYRAGFASTKAALPFVPDAPQGRDFPRVPLSLFWGAAVFSVIGIAHVRNSRGRLAAMLVVLLLVTATQFACGGGSGNNNPPPPPPTAFISASPASIGTGQSSTLTWNTSNATTITLDGAAVAATGSKSVSPSASTTYHLLARGSAGSKEASATVTVINTTTATVTVRVTAAGIERTATVTVTIPA